MKVITSLFVVTVVFVAMAPAKSAGRIHNTFLTESQAAFAQSKALASNSGLGLFKSTCCEYSNEPTLVKDGIFRKKVPVDPLTFPKKLHSEFDINAWCYFGQLKGSKDSYSFISLIQKVDPVLYVLNNYQIGGGIQSSTSDYDLGGCIDIGIGVSAKDQPWGVSAKCLDKSELSINLKSGVYGVAGATYSLRLHSTANHLDVEIELADRSGMVNQGMGGNSFVPNWLTTAQQESLGASGLALEDFVAQGKEDLSCQGSYYFSQPNLVVTDFTIHKNGELLDSAVKAPTSVPGDHGVIWFDYVAQTYDKPARELLKAVGWVFFAVSFPKEDMAIFVTEVETSLGKMPSANLFKGNKKIKEWHVDRLSIEPIKESAWTSPKSQRTYYMDYAIHLHEQGGEDIVLSVQTLRHDQEIGILNQWKYEGLGKAQLQGAGYDMSTDTVFLELEDVQKV